MKLPECRADMARAGAPLKLGALTAMLLSLFGSRVVFGQAPESDFVTVEARPMTSHLTAYGQVEPISLATVSATEAGVITDLKARPGMRVHRGQELARLSGPAVASLLVQSEAAVHSAQSQVDAAEKSLAIAREQLPSHLTTRQAVQQAESTEAQARSALVNAQSRLSTVRELATISSPADGTVLQLMSADGALVSTGQPVLTIQPGDGLWLVAQFYGADLAAIRAGMTGVFEPSDGGKAVKIRVASVPGTLSASGGESVAMEPVRAETRWLSGQAGTVMLDLRPQQLIAIPTRALVLNQGKWWVMVHTASGDRAQQVVPGPTQGWDTFLLSGLSAGAKVVVNNAYLLFHANVSEHYQIPN